MAFQGFTEQVPDFFWELRFNNDRAWFEAHKALYQAQVQQPLRALADELFDWFQQTHPELHMNLHISRIYRDARRLFGRGPFKDHLWISFQAGDRWNNVPCFYFEIGAEGWGYGMGCWTGEASFAQRFRRQVDCDPAALERLLARLNAQDVFRLSGQRYARSKGHTGKPIEDWYNMKGWSLTADMPYDALAASPALVGRIEEGFEFLLPYYRYLNKAYLAAD